MDRSSGNSVIEIPESVKVKVEPEDTYEDVSNGVGCAPFEEYIGIEPDDLNLNAVKVEKQDPVGPDPLEFLDTVEIKEGEYVCGRSGPSGDFSSSLNRKVDGETAEERRRRLNRERQRKWRTRQSQEKLDPGRHKVYCFPAPVPEQDLKAPGEVSRNQECRGMAVNEPKEAKGGGLLGQQKLSQNVVGFENLNNAYEDGREPIFRINNDCVNINSNDNVCADYRIDKFDASKGRFISQACTSKSLEEKFHNYQVDRLSCDDDGLQDSTSLVDDTENPGRRYSLRTATKEGAIASDIAEKSHDLTRKKRRRRRCSGKRVVKVERFFCDICQRGFGAKIHLGGHVRVHNGVRPFKCSVCDKAFAEKSSLRRHNSVHVEDKPYVCKQCGKSFKEDAYLMKHMKTHRKRKYSCDICNKTFNWKSSLNSHVKFCSDDNPFLCDICLMSFSNGASLREHLIEHVGPMPFHCDVCGKGFAEKRCLRRHRPSHNKERPFFCRDCNKTFKTHLHLNKHIKTHFGMKTYVCSICRKSYTTDYKLKEHMHVHSTEKPYLCSNCGIRFSFSTTLEQHLKLFCKGK